MSSIDGVYAKVQTKVVEERLSSPEELAALAGEWKDERIPELQRQVAEHALQRFLEGIIDPFFESLIDALRKLDGGPLSVLDLACASGYYSMVIRHALGDVSYTGADYSEAMIALAKQKHPNERFLVADATATGFEDAAFDCVLLSGALEHIPDHGMAIRELCRISRRYVILHRATVSLNDSFLNALGSQYSILTPKIYFPMTYLNEAFAGAGYHMVSSQKTWKDSGPVFPIEGHPVEFRTILFERVTA